MSRLNYHHLYYFWRVATLGNLTQTAESLHVSQSALSMQIKHLEDVLGFSLFHREGRKLTLTENGSRILAYANEIFSIGEELESLLKNGIELAPKRIRIGMLSTMSRNFIERFIEPLLHEKDIQFSLHARGMENLLNGLSKHQFDLVLSNINIQQSSEHLWQSYLLARQPVAIVGPRSTKPDSPFPMGFEELSWILPAETNPIRIAFDGFCARWQFTPKIHAEADDMAMLRLLTRDSDSLAVLPEIVVKDEIESGKLVNYMNLPNVFESFYAITIKRTFVPDLIKNLLAHFENLHQIND